MSKLKRIVIKEELVELTGDFRPAIILNQFLYWSERMFDTDKYIQEEKERARNSDIDINIDDTKGWIYKKAEELNQELMIGMSIPTIRKYIKQLVDKGYLLERRNPKHTWDKTMQYRVDMYKLQLDLGKLGYALEGYKLLPNIKIIENIEDNIVDIKIGNKKDLSVGADKPCNEVPEKTSIKKIVTNSITEKDDMFQEEISANSYEENKLKVIEHLRITVPNFNEMDEVNKDMRIYFEMKRMKYID